MKISYLKSEFKNSLEPFESFSEKIGAFPIAGSTFSNLQEEKLKKYFKSPEISEIRIRSDFWPSKSILEEIAKGSYGRVFDKDGELLLEAGNAGKAIQTDKDSAVITYPWDFIKINEEIISALSESVILGTVRAGANIDGVIILGEGSVILPGVYVEGNAIIGKNCKIGPNCYIRGNTFIGDNCHIGQAVEIKNSLLMNKVSVGHLSYVGDSVIGTGTNFGAGTITANLRHDGRNHRSLIGGEFVDTGRRKLGVIVGENVHTGITTSIYPGVKIYQNAFTLPGEVVKNDKR